MSFFTIQDNGAFVALCGPSFAVRRSHSGRKDGLFILKPTATMFISLFQLIVLFKKVPLFSFLLTVYTFEDPSHLSAFTASSTSTLERTTTRIKTQHIQ